METQSELPANPNFLVPNKFRFDIALMPVFASLVTKVQVPPIILNSLKVPTPLRHLRVTGQPAEHQMLTVTFKIDENLEAYMNIVHWMQGLGFPDSTEQYAAIPANKRYSDGSLTFLTAQNQPNVEIYLEHMFPTMLSGFSLDATVTDIQTVDASVSFEFQAFTIKKL